MLSDKDYCSLKKSVKGWTAKRLRAHGVSWPPLRGWRKRLLQEYREQQRLNTQPVRFRPSVPKPAQIASANTPDLDIRLRRFLDHERNLTCGWYARMTDGSHFPVKERQPFLTRFEVLGNEIRRLQQSIDRQALTEKQLTPKERLDEDYRMAIYLDRQRG